MMMELANTYPESPMEPDDAYPCKGCGEILEEGKAFELANNRWHIDCFRCNTCGTLLDSDANLLLLGDGSLICNNCTYSCSACGNKIEDLAILTGDQAFCASCFRCRSCKKKIENLRYARTSQGIFCMECHEGLMARRRKKAGKGSSSRQKQLSSSNTMLLDKSLPSLPPSAALHSAFSPDHETPPSDTYSDTPTELPAQPLKKAGNHRTDVRSAKRERSPAPSDDGRKDNLMLPSTTYRNDRHSHVSQRSDLAGNGDDFIPMALDLQIAPGPSPMTRHQQFDMQDANKSFMSDVKVHSRDYFNTKVPHSSSRKVSQDHDNTQGSSRPVSRPGSHGGSQPSSPHIAYQEKGREPTSEIIDTIRKRNEQGITNSLGSIATFDKTTEAPKNGHNSNDKFKLQEVPKRRRSGTSARNSKSDFPSTGLDTSVTNPPSNSAPASASTQLKEQHVVVSSASPRSGQSSDTYSPSPRSPKDSRPQMNGSRDPSISHSSPLTTQLQHVPLRGDSLQKTSLKQSVVPRKEMAGTKLSYSSLPLDTGLEFSISTPPSTTKSQGSPTASMHLNGNKPSSKLLDSPVPRHSFEAMQPPPRAKDRPVVSSGSTTESFISPRAPPHPPLELQPRARNESVSTIQSESTRNGDLPASPSLPRYSAGGDFSMDEDMARILGNEDGDQASFLRRVSNSVRHARSYSDRGTRLSKEHKWPKSPLNGSNTFPREVGSPASSSPETREELMWFKNEFRRERQKTAEKDQKIAELEAALDGRTTIKQMNHELNEKRSTMIVLDTQKEIVVRELEVLTEHIAASKRSRDPLDLSQMRNLVLREFGESLEKLKSTFAPQIMDLTEKRNDLMDEVSRLTQLREQSVQEFEQLSVKNAQLAELNNQLVHQIQALYKANANSTSDAVKPPPQGLGIYTHHTKDKSNISMDSRELRPSTTESTYTGSTVTNEHEVEPATILTAPQVVNIRKGQPKKFNWKKGGQNVAKGVSKGLKGAFTSNDTTKYQQREGSITEGTPYGAILQSQEYPSTSLQRATINDPSRQGFGFFNNGNQRLRPAQARGLTNGVSLGVAAENASVLYGSELEQRAEYEKVSIPGIVTRCVKEVERRGIDTEGIYRKSGGNSQIQHVKEGFEQSNDFDISDADLDINAVTSALKQYFRKLPTPLITYPIYDKLLDSTTVIDEQHRILLMRSAINELPARHRDCLEFLVFHLARVAEREKENLMTSLNVAVVFAPTIMRPESIAREMSDTQAKNQAVQFMIENCHGIFHGED